MKKAKPRIPTIDCPHCASRAIVRSSEGITPICRKLLFDCTDCGHRFVAQLAILHSVRPSDCPNPAISLPLRLLSAKIPAAPVAAPANDFAANEPGISRALDEFDQIAS